jgi:enoyl-CoA hydratase/carnithine racemase
VDYDFGYEVAGDVATITLSRPDVMNALTFSIYAQLRDLMAALRTDDEVRAVIITGEGKGFCTGGDVNDIIGPLLEMDVKGHLEFTRMTGDLIANMRLLDKPIIAAVNGMAAGAGAVIALASDLRLLSSTARFAFLFTKVGLTGADMGAGYLLPRVVGAGRAAELLLLGDTVDAPTAERYGLATRVVEPDQCLPEALALAARLAKGPLDAYTTTKQLMDAEWTMTLHEAIEAEALAQQHHLRQPDHRDFHAAFAAKRPPVFSGERRARQRREGSAGA